MRMRLLITSIRGFMGDDANPSLFDLPVRRRPSKLEYKARDWPSMERELASLAAVPPIGQAISES